ncbi:uncharacterized protein LOC132900162 [Neoarius graeffei]|uniref:uncharacterized protein LOC132900162 n=1 Tax=Neoarius graeffei TaxID=443677 RepID=UPI00298CCDF5|nr:uncharacterized protein LOC132900162 [Neoarius graeffei]
MVCSGVLGFILLFLLHPALGIGNLQNIINKLHQRYGVNNQYALGINVPDTYCNVVADPDQNFLSQDNDAQKVKNAMNGPNRIYKGHELIGARPKPIGNTGNNFHSEYLLLISSNEFHQSLMQTLLNNLSTGCAVFFTLNSPCVRTCSTPNGPYSIIPALNMFNNHNGPKAFVFREIWHHDVGTTNWKDNILEVNQRIPLYRCTANGCVRCVNNNVINDTCYKKTV